MYFENGKAAYIAGKELSDNPHTPHEHAFSEWVTGWLIAKKEFKKPNTQILKPSKA